MSEIEKIQIKYDGKFQEIPIGELDLNPASPSDWDVRTAVERYLDAGSLSEFVVEPPQDDESRTSASVLVLRPIASYG